MENNNLELVSGIIYIFPPLLESDNIFVGHEDLFQRIFHGGCECIFSGTSFVDISGVGLNYLDTLNEFVDHLIVTGKQIGRAHV